MAIIKKSSQIKFTRNHVKEINSAEKHISEPFSRRRYEEDEFWEDLEGFLCLPAKKEENLDITSSNKDYADFRDNLYRVNKATRDIHLEGIFSPGDNGDYLIDDSDDWLGSYSSISSPGLIKLNVNKIQVFFYSILRKLIINKKHKINYEEFSHLARLTVYKTYFHELFHHFSDIYGCNRQGKDKRYAPKHRRDQRHWVFESEEALAVAASRHLTGMFCTGAPLLTDWLDYSYQYTSNGYKEWKKYQSHQSFRKGVVDYFDVSKNLRDSSYDHLEDLFAHQYLSLINNPFAILRLELK